jgi:hypothetical protein
LARAYTSGRFAEMYTAILRCGVNGYRPDATQAQG